MRLLAQAREAGLTVGVDGDKLVVRGPRRLEPLAWEVLAKKPDVIAALYAERDPAVAVVMQVFPGSRVVAESQPLEEARPGAFDRRDPREFVRILEAETRPAIPCPTCGQHKWWRGTAMWVCAVCHPDPRRVRADDGDNLSADRAALLDLARDKGWPEVSFKVGHSVVGSGQGWRAFARTAPEEDLLAACRTLEPDVPAMRTPEVIRRNLARIKLITVDGLILCNNQQTSRVLRLLENRKRWGDEPPLVMPAVHNDEEAAAAASFMNGPASQLARFTVVPQRGHNETLGHAVELFRKEFDATASPFEAKRHILLLTRRGGKGTPNFVSPFTHGEGTTCGAWTRPVVRKRDGTPLHKGFMKANVTVGFCPVECRYCYLNMTHTESMEVACNLEDLADELNKKWRDYPYPINFGEEGGLVEYDEWFVGADGHGSMVQFVIDACAVARVTPFFLTKIRYPHYLRFNGRVQVGISLMPEPVRTQVAPHGSPSDELLDSLAWAVSSGAIDPVLRMTVIWQQREAYRELLQLCRDRLGTTGWRLTLDILRFTPRTASTIAARYPDAAEIFAREIAPDRASTFAELAREAGRIKKMRPPADRQAEIFLWFREQLNLLGCTDVMLTACKGDPDELMPLVRRKVIRSMPCACYGCKDSTVR